MIQTCKKSIMICVSRRAGLASLFPRRKAIAAPNVLCDRMVLYMKLASAGSSFYKWM